MTKIIVLTDRPFVWIISSVAVAKLHVIMQKVRLGLMDRFLDFLDIYW
jgi:hypothetical protein